MSFRRAVAPETIATEDLGQPKCLAIKPTSSVFPLPSTGEERRRAVQVPESSDSSELTEERGFARTVMTNELPLGNFVVRCPVMPVQPAACRYTQPHEPAGGAVSNP